MIRPLLGAGMALAFAVACSPAETKPAAPAPVEAATPPAAPVPYGANAAASGTFTHGGATFYYETYGQGDPLLLIHGNGLSIGSFAAQIDHFKSSYRVIAMDSRAQGKSTDGDGPITYEIMADDQAALIDHLKLGQVDVLGWSDGGIEALLLGIRHPDKVKKLVAMAANLNPGPGAVYKETDEMAKQMVGSIPKTPEHKTELKVASLMTDEPHIDVKMLEKIAAPTLVLAGDHDLIRLEHTVDIYNHIPNANLAIFPNSTHGVPYDDPEMFNATVERFLKTPFKQKDRIGDLIASLGKMMGAAPK